MERNERLKILRNFMTEHGIDMEELLELCAEWLTEDKNNYVDYCARNGEHVHSGIISTLQSAIDGAKKASFDYYVSTK
jgi:hypothetical protein